MHKRVSVACVQKVKEVTFIQVLLPLKLAWNPWYYVPEGMEGAEGLEVGTRVKVKCARKEYVGAVVSKDGAPDIDIKKIQPIISVETALEKILPGEFELWKFIADYYMCTPGEVFKAAYPALRVASEAKKAHKSPDIPDEVKRPRLAEGEKKAAIAVLDAFDEGKTVLLRGLHRESVYNELARRTLEAGRDVLILSPAAPNMNYTLRREVSKALRSSKPAIVRSGRTAIFLPYTKLGLVIVDEEQDISYKQESPAPRYNARDVAAVLARNQSANLLLGSSAPSLEALYNVGAGKFRSVEIEEPYPHITIVGTDAERRKNGMVDELSRILIARKETLEAAGKKVLVINSWELGNISKLKLDKYALVAVLHFEHFLSKQDFRADEKACFALGKLRSAVKGELLIQTKDASHPVFSGDEARLLEERRQFNLPPFTRQIVIRNSKGDTVNQAFIPKDRNLRQAKIDFVGDRAAAAGLTVDVDPY